MNKNILIISIAIAFLSLTAFAFISWNDSETDTLDTIVSADIADNTKTMDKIENRIFTDFIYDIGPRFNPIKKRDLDKAKSFTDFIGEEHAQRIVSYKTLNVIILEDDKQTDVRVTGSGAFLNDAQIEFLRSLDYSTNILVWADYIEKNVKTGELEESHWTPYLTIVPEKQAEYASGKEALIDYLKENIKDYTVDVQADKLQPAKLYFTVTQSGAIEHVKLDRSSNFPVIDKKMIELITKAPGKWKPAENSKGEKVDQELVISFGLMGC